MSAAARPLGRGGSSSLLNMNVRRKNLQEDGSGAGPSTTQSEPPPSPQLAYFDKYPKRAERLQQQQKHVTIEFPTIPERKSAAPRHAGGLRDWRVVQAHLEPRVAPRKDQPRRRDKDKEREKDGGAKIRDPDDMVIVSLAGSPSPTSSTLPPTSPAFSDGSTPTERTPTTSEAGPSHEAPRRRPSKTPSSPASAPATPSSSAFVRPPPSPSLASGFRSSLISSAGTLTSSAATDASALTPPRTPTSTHDSVLIASSSVEAMDALIEGMGPNSSLDNVSFLSPSFARPSRFGYPPYQPPLPTPPDGVKLGIVDAQGEPWRRRPDGKNPKPSPNKHDHSDTDWAKRYDDDEYDETETETDASALPSRRTPTTSTSTFASTSGATKSITAGRDSSSSASSVPRGDSAPPSRTSTPADPNPSAPTFRRSITSTTVTTTTPPIRIRSDEEIEAEERADVTSPLVPPVRVRQRSGLSVRSAMSGKSRTTGSTRTISTSSTGSSVHRARGLARSPGMWDLSNASSSTDLMETDGAMDAIIKNHVSRTGEEKLRRSIVPSIDDIIRMHSPAVVAANQAASKSASRNGSAPSTPISGPAPSFAGSSSLSVASGGTGTNTPQMSTPGHSRSASRDEPEPEISLSRSSVDSIADEAQRALQALQEQEAAAAGLPRRRASVGKASSVGAGVPTGLKHARSFPKARASSVQGESSAPASLSPYFRSPLSDGASVCSGNSGNTVVLPPSLGRAVTDIAPATGDNALEMAQYLRSPRLTRLLTLRRPANAGLTVSLADVGSLTGRPVIVYLGLGCVRYLVALYDEMAEALNLRLICVDRWGLGRTTDVPTEKRGLLEWAGVVEEVADTLGLGRYSVLAHSAGAPYALASSLKAGDRLFGSVHLLAPWVSMAVDGGYKWLKYVPNGLIKTAQAAEWKFQGWMIGKPPTIQYEGIGFDASAPLSGNGPEEIDRPSFSSFDELDDFDGRFASRSTLAHAPPKDDEADKEDKKDKSKQGGRPRQVSGKSASGDKVEDNADSRPRKGSKSIFGGLFANTLPKNGGTKRGMSTPPSAFATPTPTPAPPPPMPPIPVPPSPPTPTARPQKLKGLRSMSSLKAHSTKSEPAKPKDRSASSTGVGLGLGMETEDPEVDAEAEARTQAWASEFGTELDGSRPRQRRSLSLTARPSTAGAKLGTQITPNSPRSPGACTTTATKTVTLASALLQASHAESLKGGTADLLSILERDSKPWGFSYADVRQPVRVWYGDRDDKIGIGSVRWMERVMKACDVKIVKGAGHSLMTNAEVVVEVLESIAREWDEAS